MSNVLEVKATEGYSLEEIVKAVMQVLNTTVPAEPVAQETPTEYVPKGSVKRYKSIEEYPPVMFVEDVKDFTRLCTTSVYELLNHQKCPTRRYGRKLAVYRDEFFEFYIENRNLLD